MFTHWRAFRTHREPKMTIVELVELKLSPAILWQTTCNDFRHELDLPLLLLLRTSRDQKSRQVEFKAKLIATKRKTLRCLHIGAPSRRTWKPG